MKAGKPELKELQDLLKSAYPLWEKLNNEIEASYTLTEEWHTAGKAGKYEKKLKKGSKTVISFFAAENKCTVMVIYGKDERESFEKSRNDFSGYVNKLYDESKTYRDGKWIMLESEMLLDGELTKLAAIKRKPDK